MPRKDRGHILFAFVSACVVGKNLNIPNWSSVADNAITQGGTKEFWDLWSISVVFIKIKLLKGKN